MDIVVRKYQADDYKVVDSLLWDTFHYHKGNVSDSRVYEFVGCIKDEVVGYFNLMEENDIILNQKIYHVGWVCVDSNKRGMGIGRSMMEFAISFAKEHGGYRMELTSGNQRVADHHLYLSLGFEKRDSSIFRKELV